MNIVRIIKSVYRPIRDLLLDVTHVVLGLVPKRKNLIVLTSWFGERYADNTMYLFEYLLGCNKNVVWATKNKNVYKELKARNLPVLDEKTLKGLWLILRAECLISTIQLSDYNKRLLTKCVFVDLDHGIPFKQAGYAIVSNDNAYLKKRDALVAKRIRYYLTATSYPCAIMLSKIYNVPMERIILTGKPRDDVFFEKSLLTLSEKFERLIAGRKVITYMPTHRNCGREALNIDQHLDFEYINNLCQMNGYLFLIKKHFYHKNETVNNSSYENIIDITEFELDSQYLLYKTDVLITDYSSVCPEFLLLNRPVILYPYDLKHYLEYDRDLFFPMEKISFVDKPMTIHELNKSLYDVISGKDPYRESRMKFKKLFFDESIANSSSRNNVKTALEEIMNNPSYVFNWNEYKDKYKDKELIEMINNLESALV